MDIGDRVKVARIDDYTAQLCKSLNIPTQLGRIGIVDEIRYNPNMHRTEVVIISDGSRWMFEPWQLMEV